VEKVVVGLVRAVAAPVEKATDELEKAAVGWRSGGEGGRRAAERRVEKEEGGRPRSGTVEMLAVEPPATVENAEAAQLCGDFF
jgi:hypothetical protein